MNEDDVIFYLIALSSGLIDRDEVIKWADQQIQKLDNPPPILYDITLSTKQGKGEIVELLKSLINTDLEKISVSIFERIVLLLKKLLDSKSISSDTVAENLNILGLMSKGLPSEYQDFCLWIDDEFDLVRKSILKRAPLETELTKFLNQIERKYKEV